MEKEITILILEDFKPDVELIKWELTKSGIRFKLKQVDNRKDFLARIKDYQPDIIISDYSLPQYDGITAIQDLKKLSPETPIVIVTGSLEEETAASTIKAGAWDYVVKERLYRLPSALLQSLKLKAEIDKKNQTEKILKKTESEYETLRNNVPLALYRSTLDGKLIYANPAYMKMFGFDSMNEAIRYPVAKLYVNPKDREELMKKLLEEETIFDLQIQLKRKDGSKFWASFHIRASFDKEGNHIFQDGIINDITELKKTHEELVRAKEEAEQADHLKTAFLANMSHEIRTPMNAIIGFSDLLTDPEIEKDEIFSFVRHIQQNSETLLKIIGDIIDIAKIEAGIIQVDTKPIELVEIFNEIHSSFINNTNLQKSDDVEFKLDIDAPDQTIIVADPIRIKQIMNNLITNAFKFTEKGKVIFGFKVKGQFAEIYVSDTGLGIPEEKQELIFERFRQADDSHTREFGGTGLGLTIARSLVEKMGGKIWVESKLNKGATFIFSLPLYNPNLNKKNTNKPDQDLVIPLDLSGKKILIAEDVDSNFLYLETLIKQTSAEIIRAHDGQQAVESCNQAPDIDLVLMDIQMPNMNGYVATRKIRETRPNLLIIGQTAYALSVDKQKVLDAGCNDYLIKPLSKQKLYHILKKYLAT